MPRRDKFIDKKKAVSYKLIHNESGPSEFEENALKHVFVPTSDKASKFDSLFIQPQSPPQASAPTAADKYPGKGPRPDWDPDVVACLDNDFDFNDPDNIIEDDFVSKANALTLDPKETLSDEEQDECDSVTDGSFGSDFFNSINEGSDIAPKSRFTEYSMTSAVTNCSENVKTFNERFEKFLEDYDDDQIGSLDMDDVDGNLNAGSCLIDSILNAESGKKKIILEDIDEECKHQILDYAETDAPEEMIKLYIKQPVEGDCESYISSIASSRYRPTVIRVNEFPKNKISVNLSKPRLTKGLLNRMERENNTERLESECSDVNSTFSCNVRSKHETAAERKERKKIFKEAKRENRIIKKENKMAFREEKRKQQQQIINSRKNMGTIL